MYREVHVYEIREVLRLWMRGNGFREVARLTSLDRKTVRRYVEAAVSSGLLRDGADHQLTDELLGQVCEAVRPHRPDGHGASWATVAAQRAQIESWVKDDLTVVKMCELLSRAGIVVPERTLHRFVLTELGHGRSARGATVRVADGEPGVELQVDFGRMGLLPDPSSGRQRVCRALICTACYSRHCFVFLAFSETTAAVIEGLDAAWEFFNGVFPVLIPDNMSAIVTRADPIEPRFNEAFVEYAQHRGFVIDPARVRTPTDKPRVERVVPFTRGSLFAGESFVDREEAQARAVKWCRERAGMRVHGTTKLRPAEVFALEEAPRLLPAPDGRYDLPIYKTAKVHRDHHIEVARSLYSIPGDLIGREVDVRADSKLVRVSYRGTVVKVHPRTHPGGRVTDAADLPQDKTIYAMRDLDRLQANATACGENVGRYAAALLDSPLPWTRMRQVYVLLGLVKKWGPEKVDTACARALEAEAVSARLIARMLERATESSPPEAPRRARSGGRFARDSSEFATTRATKSGTNGSSK